MTCGNLYLKINKKIKLNKKPSTTTKTQFSFHLLHSLKSQLKLKIKITDFSNSNLDSYFKPKPNTNLISKIKQQKSRTHKNRFMLGENEQIVKDGGNVVSIKSIVAVAQTPASFNFGSVLYWIVNCCVSFNFQVMTFT